MSWDGWNPPAWLAAAPGEAALKPAILAQRGRCEGLLRALEAKGHPLAGHFVFVTGDVLSDETARLLERTQIPCLGKPFTREQVLELLDRVFADEKAA